MKCVARVNRVSMDEIERVTKHVDTSSVKRVTDKLAAKLVGTGAWSYVPKTLWKTMGRP